MRCSAEVFVLGDDVGERGRALRQFRQSRGGRIGGDRLDLGIPGTEPDQHHAGLVGKRASERDRGGGRVHAGGDAEHGDLRAVLAFAAQIVGKFLERADGNARKLRSPDLARTIRSVKRPRRPGRTSGRRGCCCGRGGGRLGGARRCRRPFRQGFTRGAARHSRHRTRRARQQLAGQDHADISTSVARLVISTVGSFFRVGRHVVLDPLAREITRASGG